MKASGKTIVVAVLLFSTCVGVEAQEMKRATPTRKVRIAVLYKNELRDRYPKGIQRAKQDYEREIGRPLDVEIKEFPYLGETKGLEKLIDLIKDRNNGFDIVLGPTDSGVFLRALEQREELERYQVPVISPLVTAIERNQPDGWFFSTNVDVVRRVNTIHDFLKQYWLSSIGVLYASTEFGRLAEKNFRENLSGLQRNDYQAYRYREGALFRDVRQALEGCLARRPEAVGIFGSNDEIVSIYQELEAMTQGIAYQSMFFTVVDASPGLAAGVDNLYFVSTVKRADETTTADEAEVGFADEVEALAYDTTRFILHELNEMPHRQFDPDSSVIDSLFCCAGARKKSVRRPQWDLLTIRIK